MGRGLDSAKREAWRRRLREFAGGGESIARFCDREGVSVTSFYRWRQVLASRVPPDDEAASRVRTVADGPGARMTFLPVAISPGAIAPNASRPADESAASDRSARIEVLLPGGVRLLVPGGDAGLVRTVIAALADVGRGVPAC